MRILALVLVLIGTLLQNPAALRYGIALLLLTDGQRLATVPRVIRRFDLGFSQDPFDGSRHASSVRRALTQMKPRK